MRNDQRDNREGVSVVGTGRAAAAVDQVGVTLGVEILRPDAGEAFRTAAGTVTRLLTILADNGVDARSVRTADLSLGPRTDYRDGHEVLLGYQAGQRLLLQLDGLGQVEQILSEVVAKGGPGVRIDQVTLTAGDPQDALTAARAAAFADATARAEQYAVLAGRTLGAVQRISEIEHGGSIPLSAAMGFARSAAADSMPVAGGDTEVSVSVQVNWALAPSGSTAV